MQFTAKLIKLLPLQTGSGKKGEWKKQDIIIETEGQYPKQVCISIWGDKINYDQLIVGKKLKIDFDLESREFNGRWYTEVKAWKVEPESSDLPQKNAINQNNNFENDNFEIDNKILPF